MTKDILEYPDEDLTDDQIRELLFDLTGDTYKVHPFKEMYWGKGGVKEAGNFYHIMPVAADGGFYTWYYNYRQHNQRFKNKANAVLHFIHYWTEWNSRIKSKN